jgi:hypothetical protein
MSRMKEVYQEIINAGFPLGNINSLLMIPQEKADEFVGKSVRVNYFGKIRIGKILKAAPLTGTIRFDENGLGGKIFWSEILEVL